MIALDREWGNDDTKPERFEANSGEDGTRVPNAIPRSLAYSRIPQTHVIPTSNPESLMVLLRVRISTIKISRPAGGGQQRRGPLGVWPRALCCSARELIPQRAWWRADRSPSMSSARPAAPASSARAKPPSPGGVFWREDGTMSESEIDVRERKTGL